MDVREDDKPLETDEVGIVYKPDNKGADDEPKSVYVPHIDGGRYDNANRHDKKYAPERIARSTHQDSEMTLMTAQDDRDKDTDTMLPMKPISSPITPPCVHTTTLLDKDVHLKEMMVAQLNLLQQQAAMDKNQIREELSDLRNRIKWLEDRAMERQVEPTESSSSQRHQRVILQPLLQDLNNIVIPSLHPVLSQQDIWETWNKNHNNFHGNEDTAEISTPERSDDEADLAAILDLPPAKSEGENIMDDDSEVANNMTDFDMNKEDILAKKELPANNTHLYDRKHMTNQVARSADMHMNVDTKYVTTFTQPEAYEATCEIDVTTKTNLKLNLKLKNVSTFLKAMTHIS
jgi:hypothetical protein